MADQPEALRLADALETRAITFRDKAEAAAELRRLVAENIELKSKADVAQAGYLAAVQTARWQESTNNELNRHTAEKDALRAQRDELLEALLRIATVNAMDYEYQAWARAAIAKAEGEQI